MIKVGDTVVTKGFGTAKVVFIEKVEREGLKYGEEVQEIADSDACLGIFDLDNDHFVYGRQIVCVIRKEDSKWMLFSLNGV